MRIALFTPLNPKPSGISDYAEALIAHLSGLVDQIDVFIEDYQPTSSFPQPAVRVRPWEQFEQDYRAGRFDVVLYQIGNNFHHVYIYDMALKIPGVLLLHEFNLHYLVSDATIVRKDWDGYLAELEYNAGPEALERGQAAREGQIEPDFAGIAMNRRLLEQSSAAIVHSDYMVELIRAAGFTLPVHKICHGVDLREAEPAAARKALARRADVAIDEETLLLGVFGFLKPYKRIRETLHAVARLRTEHPHIRLILVGEEHPHYPLRPLISELQLDDIVRILGYVPLEEFNESIAAADISINLRWPTAGETSGSLLRAMAFAKPVLVSEIGAFLEYPEAALVRVPVTPEEPEWIHGYLKALAEDDSLRISIGRLAREFVEQHCGWPRVAASLVEILRQLPAPMSAPDPSSAEPMFPPANGTSSIPSTPEASSTQLPSTAELEEYIMSFCHDSPEMEEYAVTHLARLARTLQITPPDSGAGRVLELGCYMQITPALSRWLHYGEVRGAYYGAVGENHTRTARSSLGEEFSCVVDLFDAEKDQYPYPDGHFQAVLCCELVEHLATDPMHMIAEINRILAPGGSLVLTTPNVASLRGVQAILHGYHPQLFSSYIKPAADGTVDPRHSREFTPREVALLLEAGGFQVELLETGDYQNSATGPEWAEKYLEEHQLSTELRGEMIYCRARKATALRDRWPQDLYYPP